MKSSVQFLVCVVGCSVILGCGSQPKVPDWPDPLPVSGTITYGDAPLTSASVNFTPDSPTTPGRGASGFTDDSGNYVLNYRAPNGKTMEGIIPGKYRVTISRMVKPDGTVWKPDPAQPTGPANVGAREVMPREYSLETKLKADVKEGEDTYDFKLVKKS